MIRNLVEMNGLYDILCACCILKILNIPLINDLHTALFRNEVLTPLTERFMAHWILLYGIVRLTYSYHKSTPLVCSTYALEAATFINEMVIYSTIDETRIYHTGFTIICSLWFMRILIIEM
jgi:hypothetical protein